MSNSNSSAVLGPVLLRTSTPAPSEKVLLYLEGIARSGGASPVRESQFTEFSELGPAPDPKAWNPTNPALTKLPSEAGRRSVRNSRASHNSGAEHIDDDEGLYHEGGDQDEISSNVQEQSVADRSEAAKSRHSVNMPNHNDHHEPGPNDGPGPRYESYSSWGNFGPLPRDSVDAPPPPWMQQNTPAAAAQVPLPAGSDWMSPRSTAGKNWFQPTSARSTKAPLPFGSEGVKSPTQKSAASPHTADVNIDVEGPSEATPPGTHISASHISRTPSRVSQRSRGSQRPEPAPSTLVQSPQPPVYPAGISISVGADGTTTILVPRSPVKEPMKVESEPKTETIPPSKAPTELTRNSQAHERPFSPGSDRPPASIPGLPLTGASRAPSEFNNPLSPRSVARSFKAPSQTPSQAPSQALSQARSKVHSRAPESVRPPPSAKTQSSVSLTPSDSPSQPRSRMRDHPSVRSRGPSALGQSAVAPPSARAPSARGSVLSPTGGRAPPSAFGQSNRGGSAFGGQSALGGQSAQGDQSARGAPAFGGSARAPSVKPPVSVQDADDSSDTGTARDADGAASPRTASLLNPSQAPRSAIGDDTRRSALGSVAGSHRSSRAPPPQPVSAVGSHVPSVDASRIARSRAMSPTQSHAHSYAYPSPISPRHAAQKQREAQTTPTQSRPYSPEDLDEAETEMVEKVLSSRTPRTSVAPSTLESELKHSHFHDQDLCILLHAAEDELAHEVVKKAVRKAVQARIKKLGMKYDRESIKAYRKSFHDHDPSWHDKNKPGFSADDPPPWVKSMMDKLAQMEQTVAALGPQLERLKAPKSSRSQSRRDLSSHARHSIPPDDSLATPRGIPRSLVPQQTGDDSYGYRAETDFTHPGESGIPTTMPGSIHHADGSTRGIGEQDEFEDEDETHGHGPDTYASRTPPTQDGEYRHRPGRLSNDRQDSPGQQYLEEELYKLRVRQPSQSGMTHRSWEIARETTDHGHETEHDLDENENEHVAESEMPEIEESHANGLDERPASPPLPPLPNDTRDVVEAQSNPQGWAPERYSQENPPIPPWQRIHQRLLNWAIVWPMSELDEALNSTLTGSQVDEVSLSIWSTQMYKRYVRQQLTEVPPGRVDRLFVPPNMADAINNAVFHGRHGDACGMLRDLWTPFGLEGMPRIIVVLCKHRSDPSHWVAHKFSLPDGTLTTYDTYPEKCLPDGRPLGWWFAIRIAWPGAMYPSPDHLMQKMVRLHRPLQHPLNNSVAAAGIWRNLLMGSRAERPVDLERLRDLINTEVKNLRQRKEQGKLTIAAAQRQNFAWEEIAG